LYAWRYPNFTLNRYGPCLDSNYILPLGLSRCTVVYDFFFEESKSDEAKRFIEKSVAQSDVTQREDIAIRELFRWHAELAPDPGTPTTLGRAPPTHLRSRSAHLSATRIVGDPVWIDNVTVSSIARLSYTAPDVPNIVYETDSLLADIGSLARPAVEIERAADAEQSHVRTDDETSSWRNFETDARSAVVTGKVVEYRARDRWRTFVS